METSRPSRTPAFDPDGTRHVRIVVADSAARVVFGVERLRRALEGAGYTIDDGDDRCIELLVARRDAEAVRALERDDVLLYTTEAPGPDGFWLATLPGDRVVVTAADDSGLLYGCQELGRIVDETGRIPRDLDTGQTPDLVLRGPAIGLQKTTVEPPRQRYEYPVTPERFPWFYDREHWILVLDRLFDQRANVIYLWSGHPFSSFVRVPQFPEAVEVTDDQLARNRETLRWLSEEAERRGIRLFLQFYNIHIPLPFAQHHGIPLYQPQPSPLTEAYTRATLEEFTRTYPQVGLYVCLGEVLQGDIYGIEWLTDTIMRGIRNGAEAAGLSEPPPMILRSHNIDVEEVVERAAPLYPRLYTEAKYNGESLTTWNPRGEWQQQHLALSSRLPVHIANVHILANLEPFRYGSITFIQRSVQAMKHRLHAKGLHLYPLFYWDWPYSPDLIEPRPMQIERDWTWYEAWHRYAWQADRDPRTERLHWEGVYAEHFGDRTAGVAALDALDAIGEVAPRLLRRVGITEGNRQTFSLGMTMAELTHPEAFRPWPDLWESHAPGGERVEEYARRELEGLPHVGETVIDVAADARHFAAIAVAAIDGIAAPRNGREFAAVQSDVAAIAELADHYALRILAAVEIVSYRLEVERGAARTQTDRLQRAADLMRASVERYRTLAELTATTYRYANSMRTGHRRIPFVDGEAYDHWVACLPLFEAELAAFEANIARVAEGEWGPTASGSGVLEPYRPAFAHVESSVVAEQFVLEPGARLLADDTAAAEFVAPELEGLTAWRLVTEDATDRQIELTVDLPEGGHILIGYFRDRGARWLQPPNLETNTHADERGGLEPVVRGALRADGLPLIDVHALRYEPGRHTIVLGRGAFLVAGVVAVDQHLTRRDAAGGAREPEDRLDWLYEQPAP